MKWVIGAIVGGVASAVTGYVINHNSNKPQNVAAADNNSRPVLNVPVVQQQPPARPPVSVPPNLREQLDQLRPDAGPKPKPPKPGIVQPVKPDVFQPEFVKPKTPPAASDFDGLLAYWALDEGQGTQVLDSKGKTKGMLNSGKWVAGIRGQAVEFDGSGFIGLGAPASLNFPARGPFTIACWVKPAADSGKVFWFRSHPDGLTIVGVQLDKGKPQGWVRHDGGVFHPSSFGGQAAGKEALRVGEWHHLALSRGAGGEVELFQDGRSVARTNGGRETTGKVTTNVRALGLDPHALLQSPKNPEVQSLQGCIDEFCVFNRVLGEQEIARLAGRDE
jgi:hypothetical protein